MAAVWMTVQYLVRVRPWMYTWGADPDEVSAALPGDELVGAAVPRTTRAVTIDAPAEMVWKWLVQIGEGRGGFYSYSWLERAVGARIHNAQTVHPEWQHAQIGDPIWLARRYGDIACLNVVALKPNSHLVLLSEEDFARVRRGGKARGAWAFTSNAPMDEPGWWLEAVVARSGILSLTWCISSWNRRCCAAFGIVLNRRSGNISRRTRISLDYPKSGASRQAFAAIRDTGILNTQRRND